MSHLPPELTDSLGPRYAGRRVLVTGGAGFIGGHLVEALASLGAMVRVLDDLSASRADHLSTLIERHAGSVAFTHASILDPAALEACTESSELVMHLAAVGSVPRSIDRPQRSWDVNATGTVRVLEAARAAGAHRVVLAASSSAYGDTPTLPKREDMLPTPRSPYAASKLAAEHAACAWASVYDVDTVSLRYFNVFGPRQPAGSAYAAVVPTFIDRLLHGERPVIFGDGRHSRDFTYVDNVVLATLLAGACEQPLGGATLNIGGGEQTDLVTLAALIAEALGVDVGGPEFGQARAGDVLHSFADVDKAAQVLGYRPFVDVREGVRRTVQAARELHATVS